MLRIDTTYRPEWNHSVVVLQSELLTFVTKLQAVIYVSVVITCVSVYITAVTCTSQPLFLGSRLTDCLQT